MAPAERASQLAAWREHWHDGAIKLHVLRRLLALRAARPQLFSRGAYRPLELPGVTDDGAIAFERALGDARIVIAALLRTRDAETVAPNLIGTVIPADGPAPVELLSGVRYGAGAPTPTESLFTHLPIAVLLEEGDARV
jgi:(1->4)-alpha-D-glucan 1-alpha-D-glucosylmutase